MSTPAADLASAGPAAARTAPAPGDRRAGVRWRRRVRRPGPRLRGIRPVSTYARSSRSASAASIRRSGSRSRRPRTTGSSGAACAGGRISSKTTACRIPPNESRRNGDSPLSAAHSSAPSDHRSDSGPVRAPDIRSGAVYSGEPTKDPVSVSVVAPATCAIPKSVSTTRPVPVSRSTFAGLMSRCRTPAACAARSAPSRSMPIRAASARRAGRARDPVRQRAALDQLHDDVCGDRCVPRAAPIPSPGESTKPRCLRAPVSRRRAVPWLVARTRVGPIFGFSMVPRGLAFAVHDCRWLLLDQLAVVSRHRRGCLRTGRGV